MKAADNVFVASMQNFVEKEINALCQIVRLCSFF